MTASETGAGFVPPDPAADGAATWHAGVLLLYQAEWVNDPAPLKVSEKGRRTGITWAEAFDDTLIAAAERTAGGQNVYYIPPSKEDAIEYIETCAKWAKAMDYARGELSGIVEAGTWADDGGLFANDDPDKDIQTYRIRFASGQRIVALSSSPRRIRGKQGVIVIDEAAWHDHLPEVLKSAIALLLRGGKVRVISTHNGEDSPFNQLITEIRSRRRKGAVHRIPFLRAVGDGMYRRIKELAREADPDEPPWTQSAQDAWVRDAYEFYGDDADEELDANPRSGAGAFLNSLMIERCMVDAPVLRWACSDAFAARPEQDREAETLAWLEDHLQPLIDALDPDLEHYYGSDFARSGDLSVIAPLALGRDLVRTAPWLLELRNVPFAQQRQILWWILDRLPNLQAGAMDARGNGQQIAEETWQQYGDRVEGVMLSSGWYREHMPLFRAAFEDRNLLIPNDADVRKDLRSIKKDSAGVAKVPDGLKIKGSDGKPRHGDAAVALVLAYYASFREVADLGALQTTGDRHQALAVAAGYGGDPGQRTTDRGWGTLSGAADTAGYL